MANKPKPNLILYNPDQWRGDVLGHRGNLAARTPNVDALVANGAVSFTNAFCQNPVCTPSRCSFMSGWYPHVRGHRTMHHMLQPDEPCLLKTLKDAGYHVWWGGKNDLVPGENGYDAYCTTKYVSPVTPEWQYDNGNQLKYRGDPGGDNFYSHYYGELPTSEGQTFFRDPDWANLEGAIEFVRNWKEGDPPFCLFMPLLYPHPPFAVEEPWFSSISRQSLPPRIPAPQDFSLKPPLLEGIYERQGLQGWTEDRWNELRAVYYGMCERVDHQFGLLMEALRDSGGWDDTAVFVFSDHGEFAGDYGLVEKTQNTFEDCLTRVPFIVKPPAGYTVSPGLRDCLVELVDLRATIEELTDTQGPIPGFGKSLVPHFAETAAPHRDAVFCEGGRLPEETHTRELPPGEDGKDSANWPRLSLQQESGNKHLKAVMCRSENYKYVYRLDGIDEFYDLVADPSELRNRIEDPALQPQVQWHRDRTLRHMVETADAVPLKANRRW
jgi:arylsulfatase A-like enzyme